MDKSNMASRYISIKPFLSGSANASMASGVSIYSYDSISSYETQEALKRLQPQNPSEIVDTPEAAPKRKPDLGADGQTKRRVCVDND